MSLSSRERYDRIMNAKLTYEQSIHILGWDRKTNSGKKTYNSPFSDYPLTMEEVLATMYKGIEETQKRMEKDVRKKEVALKFSDMKIK